MSSTGDRRVRTQMKIHIWTVIIQSSEKPEIQGKTDFMQSDFIRLGYAPMRLVHRRNNPNKETLIYILLSHATEYPSV